MSDRATFGPNDRCYYCFMSLEGEPIRRGGWSDDRPACEQHGVAPEEIEGGGRPPHTGEYLPVRLWLRCEMEPEGATTASGRLSETPTPGERFNIQANGLTIEMVLVGWSSPPYEWQALDAATYEARYGVGEAR